MGKKGTRMDAKERGTEGFAILLGGRYRSSNEAATDLFPVVGFCLLAAYTVFCDEDFGRGPSSFQIDVLHHEFSESMFCWYITSPFRGEMGNRVSSPDMPKPLKPVYRPWTVNDSQRHIGFVQRKSISV